MTFAAWLAEQRDRQDTVGELARRVEHELAMVTIGNDYPSLAALVSARYSEPSSVPGSIRVQGQLRRAWIEWTMELDRQLTEGRRVPSTVVDLRPDPNPERRGQAIAVVRWGRR